MSDEKADEVLFYLSAIWVTLILIAVINLVTLVLSFPSK